MATFGNQPSESKRSHGQAPKSSATAASSSPSQLEETIPALDLSVSSFGARLETSGVKESQVEHRYSADIRESARKLAEAEQKLLELQSTPPPARESFGRGPIGWIKHKLAEYDHNSKIRSWTMIRNLANDIHVLDQMLGVYAEEDLALKDVKASEKKALEMVEKGDLDGAVKLTNEVSQKYNSGVRIELVDSIEPKQQRAGR